ncbi:hypothetical protein DK26_06870 [Bosea sp. WAO]|uniref:hypothetical protein n=1 Tax=Bosea sp. WAO TaxID=406341 RepID=UPI0007465782|nr:hypothetical protein [Bosea sp. WAO]KUL96503.1 hypothetical protein DK26_06870 [Bosea sp. WAO]
MPANVLPGSMPLPEQLEIRNIEIWIEQQVWGHRLIADQTPWFLLLEALGVMASRASDRNHDRIFPGKPVDGKHEDFSYSMATRSALRMLLFKDRYIDEIADSQAVSDSSMWTRWFDLVPGGEEKFGYLRDRFTRFSSFRNAVALLRGAEIESERKRRPNSRHLAPRGPDMLAADFGEQANGGVNKDRRFFARGGELLYLMLNRSNLKDALEEAVRDRLLTPGSRWNALARILQPDSPQPVATFENGYLPLGYHRVYDVLAEDWLALLSLRGLPDDNLPEPLMRISGLAIINYMTLRSAEILGVPPTEFPVDMVSLDTLSVQKISKDCFRRHRDQSRLAISKIVDDFSKSPEFAEASGQANPFRAVKELVSSRFNYELDDTPLAKIPAELKEQAISNHDQHLGRVVGFYAEQIGFAVARRGNGRWYAASDGLIEALVLANVKHPMEFETFLETLWTRYRMVVGSEVGCREFQTVNYAHLKANQRLLEDRLRVLGLLKRLSDDCAFVTNPFVE